MPYVHKKLVDDADVSLGYTTDEVRVHDENIVEIYGTCTTGTGTLTVQISGDNGTNWYDTSHVIYTTAGQAFHGQFWFGGELCRIEADQAMTGLTMYLSAK